MCGDVIRPRRCKPQAILGFAKYLKIDGLLSNLIEKKTFNMETGTKSDAASGSATPLRPSRSLAGKVAIVTGAGAPDSQVSNGRAISLLLAEVGASIVCVDMDLSKARGTERMILEEGHGTAVSIQANVTAEADCKRIMDTALETFGRLDILINNVGVIGAKGTATETNLEEWQKSMDINVSSMMLMVKYAVPAMLKNERLLEKGNIRGSIVNLGSVAGLQGGTPSLLYPTSKGAVVNMTRAMAAHHAQDGIRVNCVCPGT
jgi:NAD(P)-dependent dehydrogenase (short-subunit alcohol dehydrogenase family)